MTFIQQNKRLALSSLVAALFMLLAALPASARSYTIDDLVSGNWLPSESMYKTLAAPAYGKSYGYYYGYMAADLLSDCYTASVSIVKDPNYADGIIIKGMFGGLIDVPFQWKNQQLVLRTNATATVPVYGINYPANRPDIKQIYLRPVDLDDSDAYRIYYNLTNGWTSDVIDEVEDTQDANGRYDLVLSFNNKPISLNIFYTNGTSEKIYYSTYQIDMFKPTASITDTEVVNGNSTDRAYKGEFDFTSDNSFMLAGLGGRYAALKPSLGSYYCGTGEYNEKVYAQYYYSDVSYLNGTYDLAKGTAEITSDWYTVKVDNTETEIMTAQQNKTVLQYKLMELKSNGTRSENIPGTVRFLPSTAAHRGSNFWVTNGGECTTWAQLEFAFNDFVAYNSARNTTDSRVGVVKNTKIVPDKEFEITLDVDVLNDIRISHNDADAFLTATVPFVVRKNEYFPTSYEVYVVQGKPTLYHQVDMNKAQLLGTVAYDNTLRGQYSVTGTFVPTVNVGAGQVFQDDFTFFVKAIYGTEHHSAPGVRMATPLQPTHHDLTSVNFAITTGVNGINSDEANIQVEKIQGGIHVTAPVDMAVEVYNPAGALVASGLSNSDISISATGVLIVKAGKKVVKIVL